MRLYRFSPIHNQKQLFGALQHIHYACGNLCHELIGECLPNAGNLGLFCHYNDEYETLIRFRQELTEDSDNPQQKYFRLHRPIKFEATENIPETTYTHLYIRKPDPYRHHVGDVDFYLSPSQYNQYKSRIEATDGIEGIRIFPRRDLDMIELHDPDYDVLGYISTSQMVQKTHTNQGESNI